MADELSAQGQCELTGAVGIRYRERARFGKRRILSEIAAVTGYHRKHAARVLSGKPAETGDRQ